MDNSSMILHTEPITTTKPLKRIKSKLGLTKSKTYQDLISSLNKPKTNNLTNPDSIHAKKAKKEMFNCEEINDVFNYFLFSDKNDPSFAENMKELEPSFQMTTKISSTSYLDFYKKYKIYDEKIRKGILHSSCSNKFIEEVKSNLIVPNPVGIVKRQGDADKLNLNYLKLGDTYVEAVGKSLIHSLKLNEISLAKNRLSHKSILPLIDTVICNNRILTNLNILNLSFNNLGETSISTLSSYLEHPDCEITELNLEGNLLGDKLISKISKSACKLGYKLKVVNFAQNMIEDEGAEVCAKMIKDCINMQVMILYWNKIKNSGATKLVESLRKSTSFKVFDISWNNIGNDLMTEQLKNELEKDYKQLMGLHEFKNAELNDLRNIDRFNKKKLVPIKKQASPFARELGEYFNEMYNELVHLDISHNNINEEDSKLISEKVKKNHTILGIHCDGNQMTIDNQGFIYPTSQVPNNPDKSEKGEKGAEKFSHYAKSQIYYKIDNEHPLIKSNISNVRKIRAQNNCWICEGWKEQKFTFYPPKHITKPLKDLKVKLYLSFDGYKANETIFRLDSFVCYRMCPPIEIFYFFTVDGEPYDKYDKNLHIFKEPIHLEEEEDPYANLNKEFNVDPEFIETHEDTEYTGRKKTHEIYKVGRKEITINMKVIDESYRKLLNFCEPRPEKKEVKIVRPRTPWTFPISIWAAYGYNYDDEPEEYIDECFEHDFGRCNFIKDCKTENVLSELKDFLREHYKEILLTYKHLSSYLGWALPQITPSILTEFATSCPGLLEKGYESNYITIQHKTAKINAKLDDKLKNSKNVPDNIVRHEFMSSLIKIAKNKYLEIMKTTPPQSLMEVVTMSFNKHYFPAMEKFQTVHNFRINRYYNEAVDNTIKAYLPILDGVYKSYCRKNPGKKETWLTLDDFSQLMEKIIDKDFPVRDFPVFYNISTRTQINEIDNDKFMMMNFMEFLEAFSRVVDQLSPIPVDDNPEDWNPELRAEQHLSTKIENIIPVMKTLIIHNDYKILRFKFEPPVRDKDTDLLKYDNSNQFYANLEYFKMAPSQAQIQSEKSTVHRLVAGIPRGTIQAKLSSKEIALLEKEKSDKQTFESRKNLPLAVRGTVKKLDIIDGSSTNIPLVSNSSGRRTERGNTIRMQLNQTRNSNNTENNASNNAGENPTN